MRGSEPYRGLLRVKLRPDSLLKLVLKKLGESSSKLWTAKRMFEKF
jgi:hypothetical protein